jgi:serine/threonine protein kinase
LFQRPGDAIAVSMASGAGNGQPAQPQVQPCRYKVGKTLGAGSYSVVKECVHIDTGRYYAAKVINKRLMAGREHMVCCKPTRKYSLLLTLRA